MVCKLLNVSLIVKGWFLLSYDLKKQCLSVSGQALSDTNLCLIKLYSFHGRYTRSKIGGAYHHCKNSYYRPYI